MQWSRFPRGGLCFFCLLRFSSLNSPVVIEVSKLGTDLYMERIGVVGLMEYV